MSPRNYHLYSQHSFVQRLGLSTATLVTGLLIVTVLSAFTVSPLSGGAPRGLYVGSEEAIQYLDPASGEVKWSYSYQLPGQQAKAIVNQTLVQNGYVFALSQDNVLYAVYAATGQFVWAHDFAIDNDRVTVFKNVQVYGDRLYVLGENAFYTLDLFTGTTLKASPQTFNDFTIDNDILYTTDRQCVAAYQLPNQSLLWQSSVFVGQNPGRPHIANGKVFVSEITAGTASSVSSVFALDAGDGTSLWQSSDIAGSVFDLTVTENAVYFGSNGGSLYAYDATTGLQLWQQDVKLQFSAPVVMDDKVYAANNPQADINAPKEAFATELAVLDATTGKLIHEYVPSSPSADTTAVITGVAAHDTIVYVSQEEMKNSTPSPAVTIAFDASSFDHLWTSSAGAFNELCITFFTP